MSPESDGRWCGYGAVDSKFLTLPESSIFSYYVLFWMWCITLNCRTTVSQLPLSCQSFLRHPPFKTELSCVDLVPNESSKGEIWAKNNLLLFEHEKKKGKKTLFQWEQTFWKLQKNNPSTTAAELCILWGSLGKTDGLLPKETGVELPSWIGVTLHAWLRSEPRSLCH